MVVDRARAAHVDGVWIDREGASEPALFQAAAAVASHIGGRLDLGIEGIALPLHQPLRVAEDLASLDGLAEGRLQVAFRLTPGSDPAAAEEDIAVLRSAWRRGSISHIGARYAFSEVDVHPKPASADGPLLWLDPAPEGVVELPPGCGWLGAGRGEAEAFLAQAMERAAAIEDAPVLRIALRMSGSISSAPVGSTAIREHRERIAQAMKPTPISFGSLEIVAIFGDESGSV